MKKILFILFLIPLLNYGQIAPDKKLHFVAGAGISFVTYAVVYSYTQDRKKAKIYSLLMSILAGITKESIDDRFDSKDVLATGLGGASVSFSIDLLSRKKSKTLF